MSSLGGVSSSGLNFSGLATGIDTTKIIDGLTKINQRRIDSLAAKQKDITDKQTVYAGLQASMFDLQSKATSLARSIAGAFDGRTAKTSDPTIATAAAGTSAVAGTYSLKVESLAAAQQIASGGFSDPNAQIQQGTLTLQVGSGTATTIAVDSRNNTLQGLADTINSAGGDVRASIINDGSANPYRLLLSSTKLGQSNTITVTNNLTDGTGSAIDPTATTVQAASDARVTLGSGSGALTVSSASNQVTSLIPGVTLNLIRADANPVTLTVANDTAAATKSVQDFVAAFNTVIDYVADRSTFDKATNSAGRLLGDRTATGLTTDIASAVTASIPGLNPNANRLSSVGLSFDAKGHLQLDSAKLGKALSGQNGVSIADVKRLFGLTGTSDTPGVAFTLASAKTKPSEATSPYGVNITAPATRAVATATNAPAGPITISDANNGFQVKINGLTSSAITLTAGTYSAASLANLLQQKINTNEALNGTQVSVGLDSEGKFQITSQTYGSSSMVSFAGGTALADLGFTGTETAVGTNVAGNFVVNNVAEAATGSGQTLSGNGGNPHTDGLQVKVTVGAATTANVTVTQGLAGRLNEVLGKYLDASNGRLTTVTKTLQSSFDGIDKTIAKQNAALNDQKNRLTVRFAAMETAVNNLKGLQSQLSAFSVIRYSYN